MGSGSSKKKDPPKPEMWSTESEFSKNLLEKEQAQRSATATEQKEKGKQTQQAQGQAQQIQITQAQAAQIKATADAKTAADAKLTEETKVKAEAKAKAIAEAKAVVEAKQASEAKAARTAHIAANKPTIVVDSPPQVIHPDYEHHPDEEESLTLNDLKAVLQASGHDPSLAHEMLADYDMDDNGGVSLIEYEAWLEDHEQDDASGDDKEESDDSEDDMAEQLKQRHAKKQKLTAVMKKHSDNARGKLAKAQVLSKVQGFSDLSLKARTMILDQLEFEEHKKGTELAVQNQIGADCMYFLIGGEVDIVVNGKKIVTLEGAPKFQFFGEAMIYEGVVANRQRTATVVVSSNTCSVLAFRRHVFRALCRKKIIDEKCMESLRVVGEKRQKELIRLATLNREDGDRRHRESYGVYD